MKVRLHLINDRFELRDDKGRFISMKKIKIGKLNRVDRICYRLQVLADRIDKTK
jgi:hypothetical protein